MYMDSKKADIEMNIIKLFDGVTEQLKLITMALDKAEQDLGVEDVSVFTEDCHSILFALGTTMKPFNKRKNQHRQNLMKIMNNDVEGVIHF